MLKDDYIKAMSALTGMPVNFLSQLFRLNMLVVSDELYTQVKEGSDIKRISLNTYGEVRLSVENNNLIYKFIPSDEFNGVVRKTILEDKNLLEEKLEEKVVKRIYGNYTDFLEGSLTDLDVSQKVFEAYKDIAEHIKLSKHITRAELIKYIHDVLLKAGMKEVIDGRKEKRNKPE